MLKYFDAFIAAINLYCFYVFQNNAIWVRGLNLACCLLGTLCAIIETIKDYYD